MSTLRRSARAGKLAESAAAAGTVTVQASPQSSPTKAGDRKRKRASLTGEESPPAKTQANGTRLTRSRSPVKPVAVDTKSVADVASSQVEEEKVETAEAQPEKEAPAAAKPKKADPFKDLLGIRSETDSKDEDETRQAGLERLELRLMEEDAVKLKAVLSSLAPEILSAKRPAKDSQANGSPRKRVAQQDDSGLSFATLQQGLVEGSRLRDLREHLLRLRKPLLDDAKLLDHLATEPLSSAAQPRDGGSALDEKRAQLCSLTLVLSLVDQIARRYRETEAQGGRAKGEVLAALIESRAVALEKRNAQAKSKAQPDVKAEAIDGATMPDQSDCIVSGKAAGKYALHMRLPRGEYFSKAMHLDETALEKLDPGHADLVAIAPDVATRSRTGESLSRPVPTLGDRLKSSSAKVAKRAKPTIDAQLAEDGTVKPVTFLQYGNHASFAPTYDSAGATLSYAASVRPWAERIRAHAAYLAVGQASAGNASSQELISEPPRLEQTVTSADVTDIDLNGLDESLDADMIKAGLAQLARDEEISAQLRRNLILLKQLQELQWDRLRRSFKPERTSSRRAKHTQGPDELSPSAEEEAVASTLLDSLASLIALQPHCANASAGGRLSVLPARDVISKFTRTIGAIDPALNGDSNQPDFWGTLDDTALGLTKASRNQHGRSYVAATPPVIRTNTAVQLTADSEERAIRAVTSSPTVRDRGKGSLERFASTRGYSDLDQHDPNARAALQQGAMSPDKAALSGGAGLQRTGSAGPHGMVPSSPHGGGSPALPNRAPSRGSLPPQQQPHQMHPSHQPQPSAPHHGGIPGTPSRYPPGTPSGSFAHPANGMGRPPYQPAPPYQAPVGARGYGPPSAPSPGPGQSLGGMSYAYRPPSQSHGGYGHPASGGAHGSPYPPNKMGAHAQAPSPGKIFAYPAPGGLQQGGYAGSEWGHQGMARPPMHQQMGGGRFYPPGQGHAMGAPMQQPQHHHQQHHSQHVQHAYPHPHQQQQQHAMR